jgi:hypothetical protein
MPRHSRESYSAGLKVHKEQHVVCHQASPGQHLDGEEIGSGKNSHVGPDEVLPCRGLRAFRSWRDAVVLQDFPTV